MSSASASAKANKRHAARARDDWRTSRGEIDRREELRKLHFSVSSNDERTQEANRQSAKRAAEEKEQLLQQAFEQQIFARQAFT